MDDDLKARLLKPRLPEATVDLPGLGTVRVRGLSRGEVFGLQNLKGGTGAYDRRAISLCMLDPEMTEAEVGVWQEASPAGELELVVNKIQELSGVGEGADKRDLPEVRDEL